MVTISKKIEFGNIMGGLYTQLYSPISNLLQNQFTTMELTIVLYLILALISFQTLNSFIKNSKTKLPPGPFPLPLIGNLLKLGNKPHISLTELAKIYGPIMSLRLGQLTTVVISSPALTKEVLQKQDLAFSSRSIPKSTDIGNHNKYSVVWMPVSHEWRQIRKILSTNIFTSPKLDGFEHLRRQKVKELMVYVEKCRENSIAVEIGQAAFNTSLNLLSNAIFSVDLANPSQDFAKEFKGHVWSLMKEGGRPNMADFFPLLAKLDPQGVLRRIALPFNKIMDIFGQLINKRLEQRKNGEFKGDVMDVLLNISEQNNEEIDKTQIEHLCLDLFGAGTDTTSSSVEWALAELLQNPKTLKKAKAELKYLIGKGIPIEETDIPKLPYLQAIVKETMRKHPPAPFLIPRQVNEDVHICGYVIPKGSQVLVNVWAMGRDPTIWSDPTQFSPERFLDSQIDVRGRDFELIPFGAGRRICPGLSLAMRIIPVMVGSLVNCFDWMVEGGNDANEISMDEKFGITLQKAQPLRVIPI